MKYTCQRLQSKRALVELLPTTEEDVILIKILDPVNNEHNDIFYLHFQNALTGWKPKALLMGIEEFVLVPTKAIVSYDYA